MARRIPRRRRGLARRLLGILASVVLVALLASAGSVAALRWMDPLTSSFIVQRKVAVLMEGGRAADVAYRWVPWERISPQVGIAVVAAEDQLFPEHVGFDVDSIKDALEERELGGRVRGASTISQQVAKNLFLWPGRSWVRKGLEAYFTVLIETMWPKRRILEVYVNIAQFGDDTFGVGAASDRFFAKSPADITGAEAALLAAVLPNPKRLHVDRPSRYLRQRTRWIRSQMRMLGGAEYLRGI